MSRHAGVLNQSPMFMILHYTQHRGALLTAALECLPGPQVRQRCAALCCILSLFLYRAFAFDAPEQRSAIAVLAGAGLDKGQ